MKRFLGGVRGDPEPSAKRTSSAEIGAAALKDAAWQLIVSMSVMLAVIAAGLRVGDDRRVGRAAGTRAHLQPGDVG